MAGLGSLLTAVAVLYGVLVAGAYLLQERMLFLAGVPTRKLVSTPREAGLDYEDLRLTTRDGVSLHAWYLPAQGARATLLFLHGNAGNISHRLDSLRIFHGLGLSVLIFDYRGYGQSDGSPSESGLALDARAAWDYLVAQRGAPPESIVIFGRSMGAALAAALAAETTPAGLVLESAFTSVPDLAAQHYWWIPSRRLARLRFDTRAAIARVNVPVLIVHSEEDEIVPFAHGLALYAAAGPPKELLRLHGDHNTGFLQSEGPYVRGLSAFLASLTEKPS